MRPTSDGSAAVGIGAWACSAACSRCTSSRSWSNIAGNHSESNTSRSASTSTPWSSAPMSLPAQRTAMCPGPVT